MTTANEPLRMVLGAAQLGQQYGNGADRTPPDAGAAADLLDAAIRGGVTEIDTARAYGDSEAVVGRALAERPQEPTARVVTKVRPLDEFTGVAAPADQVATAVSASLRSSLDALRTELLDTVLLHRARDLAAGGGAAIAALESAVRAGVVGCWGVSISTPDELVAVCGVAGVSYVQLPFNLLDRRWAAPAVQRALQQRPDIRIVARSVLLQGLLSSNDPSRWPPIPGLDPVGIQRSLADLVAELGRRDVLDLAIGYALGQPWIAAVVLGARRPDQLPPLLASVGSSALDTDQIALVDNTVAAGPADLIDPSRWAAYRPNP